MNSMQGKVSGHGQKQTWALIQEMIEERSLASFER